MRPLVPPCPHRILTFFFLGRHARSVEEFPPSRGLYNSISLIATRNSSTPLTMGQTPTRIQEIPPRIPRLSRTWIFLKTIGTAVCDFGPSIRHFLTHCRSDFSSGLPRREAAFHCNDLRGSSLLIQPHRLQSRKNARLRACDLRSSHQNQHHLSAAGPL